MAHKTVGKITRKPGFLYFVDSQGNVKEAPLKRGGNNKKMKGGRK